MNINREAEKKWANRPVSEQLDVPSSSSFRESRTLKEKKKLIQDLSDRKRMLENERDTRRNTILVLEKKLRQANNNVKYISNNLHTKEIECNVLNEELDEWRNRVSAVLELNSQYELQIDELKQQIIRQEVTLKLLRQSDYVASSQKNELNILHEQQESIEKQLKETLDIKQSYFHELLTMKESHSALVRTTNAEKLQLIKKIFDFEAIIESLKKQLLDSQCKQEQELYSERAHSLELARHLNKCEQQKADMELQAAELRAKVEEQEQDLIQQIDDRESEIKYLKDNLRVIAEEHKFLNDKLNEQSELTANLSKKELEISKMKFAEANLNQKLLRISNEKSLLEELYEFRQFLFENEILGLNYDMKIALNETEQLKNVISTIRSQAVLQKENSGHREAQCVKQIENLQIDLKHEENQIQELVQSLEEQNKTHVAQIQEMRIRMNAAENELEHLRFRLREKNQEETCLRAKLASLEELEKRRVTSAPTNHPLFEDEGGCNILSSTVSSKETPLAISSSTFSTSLGAFKCSKNRNQSVDNELKLTRYDRKFPLHLKSEHSLEALIPEDKLEEKKDRNVENSQTQQVSEANRKSTCLRYLVNYQKSIAAVDF